MQRQGSTQFGPFEVDLETGELRKKGRVIKLPPKPSQALMLLAKNAGRLVTRDTMRKELWDSDTHVDFEHALNFCIREVRSVLGDDAKEPRYIETVARRGYRLIGTTQMSAGRTQMRNEADEKSNIDTSQQVEAYRYYESARKGLAQHRKESLEKARQDFTKAIDILPDYALAHSGMGAACALGSLNRRHPEDLEAAQFHLKKALELDPEIAEPHPWLCYVLMRKNHFEEAVRAGLRGIHLQPDLVAAHYFLGLAYFAGAEADPMHFQNSAKHLCNATRVDRLWAPSWFVLSYLALLIGDYQHAERYANQLLQVSRTAARFPFIGAEIVLGSLKLRQGKPAESRDIVLSFLEQMSDSDHMYRDAMSATAACVLGDVELREGRSDAALVAYRRAWYTVQEYPLIMAYQRIAARAQAGLAAAYASTGERSRAEDLLERATTLARHSEATEHSAAAATMGELYWTIGSASARLEQRTWALDALRNAIRTGWRDAAWLDVDPEFESLRHTDAFRQLTDEVRRWPGVRFDKWSISESRAGS